MSRIVTKVNIDRGTPEYNEFLAQPSLSVAMPVAPLQNNSTIAFLERKKQIEETKAKGIYTPPPNQVNLSEVRQVLPLQERTIKISSSPSSGEGEVTSSLSSNSNGRSPIKTGRKGGKKDSKKIKKTRQHKKLQKTGMKTRRKHIKVRKTVKTTRRNRKINKNRTRK